MRVNTHGLHIIAFVWHRTILTPLSTWAQMAWVIADKSISPALRSLQLSAEKGTSIPVGCRRMHPDFSHLRHLSITRDIYLCINFICHLLPLRCVLPAPVGQGSLLPPVSRSRLNLAGEECHALCMRLLSVRPPYNGAPMQTAARSPFFDAEGLIHAPRQGMHLPFNGDQLILSPGT